jgi:integrase
MGTLRPKKASSARNAKKASWPDAVDSFVRALGHLKRSHHTQNHYRADLAAFAKWWNASSLANELTPEAINDSILREWQNHLNGEVLDEETGETRKPASTNAKMAALQSFLKWAHQNKVIKAIPPAPKPEKLEERSIEWLDEKQQRQLRFMASQDRNPRHPAMVTIMIETGLRVAELVALCWRDILLTERTGKLRVRSGKGRKPRKVYFTPEALRAFHRLRELDPDAKPTDSVFTSQRKNPHGGRNKPLTVRGVQELLRRYAVKLKWKDGLHPHQLRHTFAKNGRNRKKPIDWPVLARLMGHSSSKTTMDSYGTPRDRELAAAMNPDAVNDDSGDDFDDDFDDDDDD